MLFRNSKGFTLAELIIAIFISTMLMAGAYATYISQNRSFVTQESVSEVNTQSKIAHDLVLSDIKSTGFGVPSDMNADPVNGFTTVVTPIDNTDAPDAVTVVGGFRLIGTLWPVGVGPGAACPAKLDLGTTQVRIIYTGTDGPNVTDKRFLSIDGVEFVRVQGCTLADGICDSSNTMTLDRPISMDIPLIDSDEDGLCDTGRPVYLVEDISYCIDNTLHLRKIRRNANLNNCTGAAASDDEVIAENVEDFQLAYAVDSDGDGQVDDTDGSGMVDAGDFVNGDAVADNSTIRAIRVNTLARSDREDINMNEQGNPPGAIENRNHDATNDDFRRRWWQTIVKMRNE